MSESDKQKLKYLAQLEIDRITDLLGPVVRVCGPLTADGPAGYERNAARLLQAEEVLKQKGYTVWDFTPSELVIQKYDFKHDDIVECFHKPVLQSGLIKVAFFLPRWEQSSGARREHELCEELGVTIKDFPKCWFSDSLDSE